MHYRQKILQVYHTRTVVYHMRGAELYMPAREGERMATLATPVWRSNAGVDCSSWYRRETSMGWQNLNKSLPISISGMQWAMVNGCGMHVIPVSVFVRCSGWKYADTYQLLVCFGRTKCDSIMWWNRNLPVCVHDIPVDKIKTRSTTVHGMSYQRKDAVGDSLDADEADD